MFYDGYGDNVSRIALPIYRPGRARGVLPSIGFHAGPEAAAVGPCGRRRRTGPTRRAGGSTGPMLRGRPAGGPPADRGGRAVVRGLPRRRRRVTDARERGLPRPPEGLRRGPDAPPRGDRPVDVHVWDQCAAGWPGGHGGGLDRRYTTGSLLASRGRSRQRAELLPVKAAIPGGQSPPVVAAVAYRTVAGGVRRHDARLRGRRPRGRVRVDEVQPPGTNDCSVFSCRLGAGFADPPVCSVPRLAAVRGGAVVSLR